MILTSFVLDFDIGDGALSSSKRDFLKSLDLMHDFSSSYMVISGCEIMSFR